MILYRILLSLAFPILFVGLVLRVLRRRETWSDVLQRLGFGPGGHYPIWVHGASNGELISAKPLILGLRDRFIDQKIIVTCNTVSARDMVENWGAVDIVVRLAPLDDRFSLRRFFRTWQSDTLIFLENELWPNRLVCFSGTIICVAGRMSKNSARNWGRVPKLAHRILSQIDLMAPQNEASGEKLLELGLRADALWQSIDLKSVVSLPDPDPIEIKQFSGAFERNRTILAASTHPGEEEIVLEAFIKAREKYTDLRLILAPRHPRRADEIVGISLKNGLSIARRSLNETADKDVYLADTLGEMALWYSLARVTFVGGSLVDFGGHTPYEPAKYQSMILHGPHVENAMLTYRRLLQGDGALLVADVDELTAGMVMGCDVLQSQKISENAMKVLWPDGTQAFSVGDLISCIEKTLMNFKKIS